MSLLQVQDLTVSVKIEGKEVSILNELTFSMEACEKVGIVGESGCGKSIAALSIMGLLPAPFRISGSISLNGVNLVGLSTHKYDQIRGDQIAMIFQEPMTALNPVMTIGDQIMEGLILHKNLKKPAARDRARELMDDVGMSTNRFPLNLYPHQLSGGQRQRVMIAAAIACEPDLLIADEPTTALDVTVQEQILNLIVRLADKSGMGLIIISHDLGVIARTTDQTHIMYTGKLVESGSTLAVFEEMSHPYTFGLFSAIPKTGRLLNEKRQRLTSIPGNVPDINQKPLGCDFADRCDRRIKRCQTEKPPLEILSENHTIRCFNPRGGYPEI